MEWLIASGGYAEDVPGYDCSASDRKPGRSNVALGVAFICYGVFAEIIYALDLAVMLRKDHRRLSCYKIMICLGLFDMTAIVINSFLTGYFWIMGSNYCTSPTLIYIAGAFGLGLWCGACALCFILIINRLLDLWNKDLMQSLFKDGRTYIVLTIPVFYFAYFFFFTAPVLFNSDMASWFFYSFVPGHDPTKYYNMPHSLNNIFVVAITCLLYVQYSRILMRYTKVGSGVSWTQKSFFIQSAVICAANLIASLIYVYMQFFPTPMFLIYVGHVGWMLGHGCPAIVYLLLNRTIQREVLAMFGLQRAQKITSTISKSPISTTPMTDS
ncbi:hypothetical protein OESDEN_09744 [Oesophagostomum dentatum]|uniref:7TM GPCR serpentine receptor class x (Srx) domain-containing protein n=1 Tax=Oesophagostomum dentatum TaxID=61180 RepID=A0A0B1SZJ2_OESDE|nr:hypothetical protein OESDEN_09744 [Oesophagostomum dentatum]